jgi:hypothetical protein
LGIDLSRFGATAQEAIPVNAGEEENKPVITGCKPDRPESPAVSGADAKGKIQELFIKTAGKGRGSYPGHQVPARSMRSTGDYTD